MTGPLPLRSVAFANGTGLPHGAGGASPSHEPVSLKTEEASLKYVSKGSDKIVRKEVAAYRSDRELELEHFRELMRLFELASPNGDWIDFEAFRTHFGPLMCPSQEEEALRRRFCQIDADGDDRIFWSDLSTFIMLQSEGPHDEGKPTTFLCGEGGTPLEHVRATPHKDPIIKIIRLDTMHRILTCGRDGRICIWTETFKLKKMFDIADSAGSGSSAAPGGVPPRKGRCQRWILDCLFIEAYQRLVVSTDDQMISFYDFNMLNCHIRLKLRNAIALTLTYVPDHVNGGHLSYGTENGHLGTIHMKSDFLGMTLSRPDEGMIQLERLPPQLGPNDSVAATHHALYNGWVNQVSYIPELHALALCASVPEHSLMLFTDLTGYGRTKVSLSCPAGVSAFGYCASPPTLITGSLDGKIRFWNPFQLSHPLCVLESGHSPITHIVPMSDRGQCVTLCLDKTIRVWDIRQQALHQILTDPVQHRPEDRLTAMILSRDQLVFGSTQITVFGAAQKASSSADRRHPDEKTSVIAALYNRLFDVLVVVTATGTFGVYDRAGQQVFRYAGLHPSSETTVARFDPEHRRLVTGSRGELTISNLYTGECLHRLHMGTRAEVTAVAFVTLDAVPWYVVTTWDRRLTFFREQGAEAVWHPERIGPESVLHAVLTGDPLAGPKAVPSRGPYAAPATTAATTMPTAPTATPARRASRARKSIAAPAAPAVSAATPSAPSTLSACTPTTPSAARGSSPTTPSEDGDPGGPVGWHTSDILCLIAMGTTLVTGSDSGELIWTNAVNLRAVHKVTLAQALPAGPASRPPSDAEGEGRSLFSVDCLHLLRSQTKAAPFQFVSSGIDGVVRFWNIETAQCVAHFASATTTMAHPVGVTAMCSYDRDTKLVLANGLGQIEIWDITALLDAAGEAAPALPSQEVSLDEAQIEPKLLRHFDAHADTIVHVEWLERDRLIVTASVDGRYAVCDEGGAVQPLFLMAAMAHEAERFQKEKRLAAAAVEEQALASAAAGGLPATAPAAATPGAAASDDDLFATVSDEASTATNRSSVCSHPDMPPITPGDLTEDMVTETFRRMLAPVAAQPCGGDAGEDETEAEVMRRVDRMTFGNDDPFAQHPREDAEDSAASVDDDVLLADARANPSDDNDDATAVRHLVSNAATAASRLGTRHGGTTIVRSARGPRLAAPPPPVAAKTRSDETEGRMTAQLAMMRHDATSPFADSLYLRQARAQLTRKPIRTRKYAMQVPGASGVMVTAPPSAAVGGGRGAACVAHPLPIPTTMTMDSRSHTRSFSYLRAHLLEPITDLPRPLRDKVPATPLF
ncbi:hypothetical protein CXG81DRAFT_23541 [Caulochytrium protostelioides]|uniref:EF-hand domain-containing protein n=1 Tax=Caulochytrium protostelioides TaxID=1555241 RepID=A0A4P9XEB7_9FUNG|nr:hypothetical protein CXG81DRAFT_23541 [Caulochytrium protostelioides]|eukprot:RKP03848.1 hypothetical protein CXG81DRAFT_23541 [Caulochytrium protostelioides]